MNVTKHKFALQFGAFCCLPAFALFCCYLPANGAGTAPPATQNAALPDPGPSLIRRLTRYEYDRTLHDLIGIDFNSSEMVGLPDDASNDGFDNQAGSMVIPPVLMEKYMAAADKICERILAKPDGKVPDIGDRGKSQKAHDALFFAKPDKEGSPRQSAQKNLEAFAVRAYRRPLKSSDTAQIMRLYDAANQKGESYEQCVGLALKGILVSPNFLYRMEANAPHGKPGAVYAVDDYAVASRLSYFLWASMPDKELFDLAEKKQLSDSAVLEQQTRRMLADPKAYSLTDNFAAQWLQIRKLANARPSADFFPTFTAGVREAMYNETALFVDSLRTEDKSVLLLLNADYSYMNEELAKHYGFKGVTGNKMQMVKFSPDDHRGGLLGMGSVLSLTSHSYRTSPTLRGKWALEVIFGSPVPPPPPGVSNIVDEEKQQKSGTSFREILSQHATRPACAGCHQRMDPLGFALDNYDAVGRWRKEQGGKSLDTSAQLPTGEKFNGADELKKIVWDKRDAFVRSMSRQMLAYAIGRNVTAVDNPAVNQIMQKLKQNDYKYSALVSAVIESAPFRYRRNPVLETVAETDTNRTSNDRTFKRKAVSVTQAGLGAGPVRKQK